jgi:hypothetical protein
MDDACCCLDLELAENALALDVGDTSLEWGSDEYVRVVTSDADTYAGPYEADALFSEQVFSTQAKLMAHDFSVHAINYTEAPNDSGVTVTIGG